MKTSELIKALSERTHFSQSDIKKVLEAASEIITEQLQAGEEVVLHRSLGTFKAESKPERTAKNNLQGGEMIIPAHTKPFFKVSQSLKDAVNL
jgi:nucleoid DNA-binding protein